jgi:hypothetical protein
MYAMKCYENPHCLDIDEFHDDLKKTKYIKRLLKRYVSNGELKERLILNHIMVLYNMFGAEATPRILFFKIDEEYWPQLKTFLFYIGLVPDVIEGINGEDILTSDIQFDGHIVEVLREL